jgi:RimJ/RimL family protein N-acetyltransferase
VERVDGIESLETSRLRLARWEPRRHLEALVALNGDAEVMRFIGTGRAATRLEAERQSLAIAAHWDRFGFGLWAVSPRAGEGRVLGFAGLSHPLWFPAEADEVEVGWRLQREAWGQGFASEAGRAGIELAFGTLGLDRVVSYIQTENTRSQAVARRLGMALDRVAMHPTLGHDVEVWRLRAGRPRRADA